MYSSHSSGHEDVIHQLYRMAGRMEALPQMAGIVARRLGVSAARIGLLPEPATGNPLFLDYNLDPACVASYLEHWAAQDLWFQGYQALVARRGRPVMAIHQDLIDPHAFHRSAFYNEFVVPQGLSSVGVVDLDLWSHGVSTGCTVAFHTHAGGKELQAEDFAAVQPVLAHLQQAVRLTLDIERARLQHAALVQGMEALGLCIVLLSSAERVLHMSTDFLPTAQGTLSISGDRLCARESGLRQELQAAIRNAARLAGTGSVVAVRRANGMLPLLLKVHPLPETEAGRSHGARVVLQLHDPARRREPAWAALGRQFGLTPAELRLVRALFDHQTVPDYCERQRITQATARTQLHSVFRKTGTRRQSELMALLAAFATA